jgi:hypothetical protein
MVTIHVQRPRFASYSSNWWDFSNRLLLHPRGVNCEMSFLCATTFLTQLITACSHRNSTGFHRVAVLFWNGTQTYMVVLFWNGVHVLLLVCSTAELSEASLCTSRTDLLFISLNPWIRSFKGYLHDVQSCSLWRGLVFRVLATWATTNQQKFFRPQDPGLILSQSLHIDFFKERF